MRDNWDGIVGLWSGNVDSYDKSQMLLPSLVKSSTITEAVFSIYMSGTDGETYIDFGKPDTTIMTDPTSIVYLPILSNNSYWSSTIEGFRWGQTMQLEQKEFAVSKANAFVDSGASCIVGPSDAIDYIRETIVGLTSDFQSNSVWKFSFDCKEVAKFPEFELLVGGYWFRVLPKDYVVYGSTGETCALCFDAYDIDYWILGDSFLRGWYSIHDYDQTRVGFVPYKGSEKTAPEKAKSVPNVMLPIPKDNSFFLGLTGIEFSILVGCLAVILISFVLLIVFCNALKRQSTLSQQKQVAKKNNSQDSEFTLIYLQ